MDYDRALVQGLRHGIWAWYDFSKTGKLLFIDVDESFFSGMDGILPNQVICRKLEESIHEDWLQKNLAEFDYIVSIAGLERQSNPVEVLSSWRKLLKADGRLLLGMNNRFGLRFFCGDGDPYTKRNFDGIEGYVHAYWGKEDKFYGRMYSKAELKEMLFEAGWEHINFYAALPNLESCTMIFAEDVIPQEDLENRLRPVYYNPDSVFLEETELYAGLVQNGMFHRMANSYFIECSLSGNFYDVQYVGSSMERGRDRAFFTLIHRNGSVEKRPAYPEGKKQILQLMSNMEALKNRGIKVLEGHMEGDSYIVPYIEAENGLLYFQRILGQDKKLFLEKLDYFRDLVMQSSEIEEGRTDKDSLVFRMGYWDMAPWNCFHKDGDFVFFDQEFCMEHYPVNAVLIRTMDTMQSLAERRYGKEFGDEYLLKRYNLQEHKVRWRKLGEEFLIELKNEKALFSYHKQYCQNAEALRLNRQRINYSDDKFHKLFVDIFSGIEDKKLILFGSGRYANRFLAMYGKLHPVEFVVDNNEKHWGGHIADIPIHAPESLKKLRPEEYRVIICIKDYLSALRQLEEMGVQDYAVFDANRSYLTTWKMERQEEKIDRADDEVEGGKYHIGYVTGVFDLFHIGHLNLLRRAKEQCDYLIAGVVTDEGVRHAKGVDPFIPFDERIEVVRACRYVDQAVGIPLEYCSTRDAWRLYHFDAQFSGSDYMDSLHWLGEMEFFKEQGVAWVVFPYTEQTSSTKIKALINQKLERK